MVQFTLPKNSQVKKGKVWPAPVTANGKKPKRRKVSWLGTVKTREDMF